MKKSYPHELIGQEIEITGSKNKSNLHLKGKVVDETKYTLKISYRGKTKTLMKENISFRITKTNQVVEGKTIAQRPEERIKQ